MPLPPPPPRRPRQTYNHRTWNTAYMMEVLSIYYGTTIQKNPRSWEYRTLIQAQRAQHTDSVYGKGYPADWKNLRWDREKKCWVVDKTGGTPIKQEVLDYARKGKLPLYALRFAATHIRQIELRIWADSKVRYQLSKREGVLPLAAE